MNLANHTNLWRKDHSFTLWVTVGTTQRSNNSCGGLWACFYLRVFGSRVLQRTSVRLSHMMQTTK